MSQRFSVMAGGRNFTAGCLHSAACSLGSAGVSVAGVHVPDGPLIAAAALWARQTETDLVLLHAEIPAEQATRLAHRFGCSHLLSGSVDEGRLSLRLEPCSADPAPRPPGPSRITLLTSGTTGEPKRITHTWESLAASIALRPELCFARWLSLYPLTRFAGFNTLLHAFFNEATLIVPEAFQPMAVIEEIRRSRPTHASGTPTLWRNLLMLYPGVADTLASLRQITLGGEVVDQQILTALHAAVPYARLTHIYASTEFGVCVAVSDGRAGFPADWLDNGRKNVRLKVQGDELWVKPNRCSSAAPTQSGWSPTGDIVDIRDGRVYIKGRRSDVLNVGGAKVVPAEVEERLAEVPGVVGARVSGRRSSMAGTLVTADVVAAHGVDQAALRIALMQHCRQTLPNHAMPRVVTFVDALPTTASGKILREGNEPA